jgi:hypothetical protein
MRWLIGLLAICSIVCGCLTTIKTRPGTPEWTAMTTRTYSKAPAEAYRAARDVCGSMGWSIVSSDAAGGFLVAHRPTDVVSGLWEYSIRCDPSGTAGSTVGVSITMMLDNGYRSTTIENIDGVYRQFFDALGSRLGAP